MSNEFPTGSRVLQKKPSESAFKQQKLPAWQPILTAGTVLPTFFVIGVAFIPIGIGILYFSDGVQEWTHDYTDCYATKPYSNLRTCADILEEYYKNNPHDPNNQEECICEITFTLNEDFKRDVFMYYGLTNFYQNHRRYVKSRDDVQLLGKLDQPISQDCHPYDVNPNTSKKIAPCGAIANSMFNDKLNLTYSPHNQTRTVPLLKTGIAWKSDKDIKFRNPQGDLKQAFEKFSKPLNWKHNIWELDPHNPDNNGFENEDFIVWMRTAALPNFRKLYRRINHDEEEPSPFKEGLPKGTYLLTVEYNYRVKGFGGKKSVILSTTSILGAKNPFLGWAYITVGCLCLLVGTIFLFIHVKYGKNSTEVVNVTPTTSYQ